jgi:hypothetical protein
MKSIHILLIWIRGEIAWAFDNVDKFVQCQKKIEKIKATK